MRHLENLMKGDHLVLVGLFLKYNIEMDVKAILREGINWIHTAHGRMWKRCWVEVWVLLGLLEYYEVSSGNTLPTLRDNGSVPSSRVNKFWPLKIEPIHCPETSVKDYHSTLCNTPEEHRSRQHSSGSLKSRYWVTCISSKEFSEQLSRYQLFKYDRLSSTHLIIQNCDNFIRYSSAVRTFPYTIFEMWPCYGPSCSYDSDTKALLQSYHYVETYNFLLFIYL
jgi:hypothetical protein